MIIDVQGIGYRVAVLGSTRDKLKPGQEITLRIYHQITDQAEALYGFASKEELTYFELLLLVPSVGPRTAMNVLEMAPPRVLEQAIAEDDTAVLTKVSGIGKKTAERILIELKERVKAPRRKVVSGVVQMEAMEALISIGYTPTQAKQAMSKLPKSVKTVEEAVKAALKTGD